MKEFGNLKLILKSKFNIALFIGAFVLTVFLVILVSRFFSANSVASANRILLKEGYDFRQMRLLNNLEPEIGSRIELADLQTSRREKLSSLLNGELVLMAVVDPGCIPCESSKDMMHNLRKNTDELGIKYLPIVLRRFPSIDVQHYAETLGFETCIQWTSELPVPQLLRSMGTPSHILTTKDGLVLQVWHGTAVDQDTRIRMSDQIASDLYLIDHIIKATRVRASS